VPGAQISTGGFNFQNYAQSGMQFNAAVNFVGGGSTGTRATDRVFGGWVQNATALDEGANYQNGHTIPAVLAGNLTAATGSYGGRPNLATLFIGLAARYFLIQPEKTGARRHLRRNWCSSAYIR